MGLRVVADGCELSKNESCALCYLFLFPLCSEFKKKEVLKVNILQAIFTPPSIAFNDPTIDIRLGTLWISATTIRVISCFLFNIQLL